ncbi:mediator of RNA polymerase II transcription subunit 15-like [Oratosquilla oratoria]|uniref:mediator of RNA polymerase II transcription subunit 15-like n=1 Tax=Oratosquilla oratoria TaxID=337810 RepID=UPI003F759317
MADDWKSPAFREKIIKKLDDNIQNLPPGSASRSAKEMEDQVFGKAKSREEYLQMVTRLVLHLKVNATSKAPGPSPPAGGSPVTVTEE